MQVSLFRALLLSLFFLLAQAGALAHGVSHILDQSNGHEPVCEQCLAFATMGAGAASTPQAWLPPMPDLPSVAAVAVASPTGFQPGYRSRAPPSLNR
jgi:hypothetical protein